MKVREEKGSSAVQGTAWHSLSKGLRATRQVDQIGSRLSGRRYDDMALVLVTFLNFLNKISCRKQLKRGRILK